MLPPRVPRGHRGCWRIGRTAAYLERADPINTPRIAEALQYRKREGEYDRFFSTHSLSKVMKTDDVIGVRELTVEISMLPVE